MADVAVLEIGDLELTKHATAQLREHFQDIEKDEVESVTEVPYRVNRMLENSSGAILLIDSTDQRFTDQMVKKLLDIEIEKDRPVQKLVLENQNESRETYKRRAQEATRENAEKLADKIKKLPERQ